MTDVMFFRFCKTSTFRETPPLALAKAVALATISVASFTAAFLLEGAGPSLASFDSLLSWLAAQDALAGGSVSLGLVLACAKPRLPRNRVKQ